MAGGPAKAAESAARAAADLARHAVWYVRYRMSGDTHEAPSRDGKPAAKRPAGKG